MRRPSRPTKAKQLNRNRRLKIESLERRIALAAQPTLQPSNFRFQIEQDFGNDSEVVTQGGLYGKPHHLSDGRLAITSSGAFTESGYKTTIDMYLPDGSIDVNFGNNGRIQFDLPGKDFATDLVESANGQLIVVGAANYGFADDDWSILRVNANGSLDTSFGSDGTVIFNPGFAQGGYAYDVVELPNGEILVSGALGHNKNLGVMKLTPQGDFHTNFGQNGILEINFGNSGFIDIARLHLNEDSTFWVTANNGYQSGTNRKAHFYKISDAGTILDTTTTNLGDDARTYSLERDSSGRFIGSYSNSSDLIIYRNNNDGTPDLSFGQNGKTSLPGILSENGANTLTLLNDEHVLVGYLTDNYSRFRFVLLDSSGHILDIYDDGPKLERNYGERVGWSHGWLNFTPLDDNRIAFGTIALADGDHLLSVLRWNQTPDFYEDATNAYFYVAGVSAGGNEQQPIRITAQTTTPELASISLIDYTSPDTEGVVHFTPKPDQSGDAIFLITAEDGGPDGNLDTTNDNQTTTKTFAIKILPVNDPPTIDALDDKEVNEDAPEQTIEFTGVTAGGNESQPLKITAHSSNQNLIANPIVHYQPGENHGRLSFTPLPDKSGIATITVSVEDGGLDEDLTTTEDNAITSRSFTIMVSPVNDLPTLDNLDKIYLFDNFPEKLIDLTGISAGGAEDQPLKVTAISLTPGLIPQPTVSYESPNQTGSLTFTPIADRYGTATIVIAVEDGGLDNNLVTEEDNGVVYRNLKVAMSRRTLTGAADLQTSYTWRDIKADDIDADGYDDFVLLRGIGSTSQRVLVGTHGQSVGSGRAVHEFPIAEAAHYTALGLGDSNSDGNLDILLGKNHTGVGRGVHTFEGDGEFGFSYASDISNGNYFTPIDVVTHDFNGDGINEIITSNYNNSTNGGVSVIFSNGTIRPLRPWPVFHTNGFNLIIEDLNNDGLSDIAVPVGDPEMSSPTGLAVMLSDGGTNFSQSFIPLSNSQGQRFGAAADLSGDGTPEILVADILSGSVRTYLNDGTGRFSPAPDAFSFPGAERVYVLDETSAGGNWISVAVTSRNDGIGIFHYDKEEARWINETTITSNPSVGDIGDFNGDGNIDLAIVQEDLVRFYYFNHTNKFTNYEPTIDDIPDQELVENDHDVAIPLSGITAGQNESQPIRITATSDNIELMNDPGVVYTSAESSGTLILTLEPDQFGYSTITVTVEDGGFDGDLQTIEDNAFTRKSFNVEVLPRNFVDNGSQLLITPKLSGQVVTTSSDSSGYRFTLSTGTWNGFDTENVAGNGTPTLTVTPQGISSFQEIFIDDYADNIRLFFEDSGSLSFSSDIRVVLDERNAGEIRFSGITTFSGTSSLYAATTHNIFVEGEQTVVSVHDGDLTLLSNHQEIRRSDVGTGILIADARIQSTGHGNLTIIGRAGNSPGSATNDLDGIRITNAQIVGGLPSSSLTLSGIGGTSSGDHNRGIHLNSASSDRPASLLMTLGGNIELTGTGGGRDSSQYNHGILITGSSMISTPQAGTISIFGSGGTSVGNSNIGVAIIHDNHRNAVPTIESDNGNISITGNGGGTSSSSFNYGILLDAGACVTTDGTGNIEVLGQGGNTLGEHNTGILIKNTSNSGNRSTINAHGALNLTGFGGGNEQSQSSIYNRGVHIEMGASVVSHGEAIITGYGGLGGRHGNSGVLVAGTSQSGLDASIVASGSSLRVEGRGGYGNYSDGVLLNKGGTILAATATEIIGYGGLYGSAGNNGINLLGSLKPSKIEITDAPLILTGLGGAGQSTTPGVGVRITDGSSISALGSSSITAEGTGGHGATGGEHGIVVTGFGQSGTPSLIEAEAGPITIVGQGGITSNSSNNVGVVIENGAVIRGAANDTTSVTGTGGLGQNGQNHGIAIRGKKSLDEPSQITSHGNLSIIGHGGGSAHSTNNHGVLLSNGGLISQTGTGITEITGHGGTTSGPHNTGILIDGGLDAELSATIHIANGYATILGRGGGDANANESDYNRGVHLYRGGQLIFGHNTTAEISGYGGPTLGHGNTGILVEDQTAEGLASTISSSGYSLNITGYGGENGDYSSGVFLNKGGRIHSSSTTQIIGYGGSGIGDQNSGVRVAGDISPSEIITDEASLTISGYGGGSQNSQLNRGVAVSDGSQILARNSTQLSISGIGGQNSSGNAHGVLITGSSDASTPSLVSSELGDLIINGVARGSAILSPSHGVMISDGARVSSNADISITGHAENESTDARGLVLRDNSTQIGTSLNHKINVSASSIQFTNVLSDIISGTTNLLNSPLFAIINGLVPETEHDKVDIVGEVQLSSNPLVLHGNYLFGLGESVVLISNDGTDPIQGFVAHPETLKPLAEGEFILFNGVSLQVSYVGGDGNDLELIAANIQPTIAIIADQSTDEDHLEPLRVALSRITAGGEESQPLAITATVSDSSIIASPTVIYEPGNATGELVVVANPDQWGTATIYVQVEDGGLDQNLNTTEDNSFVVREINIIVNPVNDPPTLDAIEPIIINEDASQQVVFLTGVSAGGGETQPIRINSFSSNPLLIQNPTITYESADSTGELHFRPNSDKFGTALITVLVEDGGLDQNLMTSNDNGTFARTFNIVVEPVNDTPTLDPIESIIIDEDTSQQIVRLSGISAGGAELQPLRITNVSNNVSLVPTPDIIYSSPSDTAELHFITLPDEFGTSTVTVTVEDGGLDGDLSTRDDNSMFQREFNIVVKPVNDLPTIDRIDPILIPEDSPQQSVSLTGISAGGGETQPIRIESTSRIPSLIGDVEVEYTSGDSTGTLRFTPLPNAHGACPLTVTIEDGGNDGLLSTPGDNGFTEVSFTVTITPTNDPPIATDSSFATNASEALIVTAVELLAYVNDDDLPDDRVVIVARNYTTPLGATVSLHPITGLVYDPTSAPGIRELNEGELREDTLLYSFVDSSGSYSNMGTMTLRIHGVNDAPIAIADSFDLLINSASTIEVLSNDFDYDGMLDITSLEILTNPQGGDIEVTEGRIRFTPNRSMLGQDFFTYRISDTLGAFSQPATVTLNLHERPSTVFDVATTKRDTSVLIDVLSNDDSIVAPIDHTTLKIDQSPEVGTAEIIDGKIRYTPSPLFLGDASLFYTVRNEQGTVSYPTSVQITISGSPSQNTRNRFDVNDDNVVSALDALVIINELNRNGARPIELLERAMPPFYDVNGDYFASALDAIAVINYLSRRQGSGEGLNSLATLQTANINSDASDAIYTTPYSFESLDDEVFEILSTDQTKKRRREICEWLYPSF